MDQPTKSIPLKLRLVNSGPLGEEKVLKSLLGPETQVQRMTLKGFGVYRQRPEDIKNDPHLRDVQGMLDAAWGDKPFLGAYTLEPQEGAIADVGYVDFDSPAELKAAHEHFAYWNFHDAKAPDRSIPNEERPKAWYRYKELFRDGDISYITEVVNVDRSPEDAEVAKSKLEPLDNNYRDEKGYQEMTDEMAVQAAQYREDLLKQKQDPELQPVQTSGELKG